MLGWRSGQRKVKMAVLSQFTYYWTESHMLRWKAAMVIHSRSHSSIPVPVLLFPLPLPFQWHTNCHSRSRGNPMGPMGSQLFPFPCTSLLMPRAKLLSVRLTDFAVDDVNEAVIVWWLSGGPETDSYTVSEKGLTL